MSKQGSPAETPTVNMLLRDLDEFMDLHWRRQPVVMPTGLDFTSLLSEEEIWEDLDYGLLTPPYFTIVREGIGRLPASVTSTKRVNGRAAQGILDAKAVRKEIEEGATHKLNHLEHWKPAFKRLTDDFGSVFAASGVDASAFLSPPGHRALGAHTDGAHVFVLQVSGTKNWLVGFLDEESRSIAGVYRDGVLRADESFTATLQPGDLMYMPHGAPHQALAQDTRSLHIAITVEEPSPLDLVGDILSDFVRSRRGMELDTAWRKTSGVTNVSLLKQALADFLADGDLAGGA